MAREATRPRCAGVYRSGVPASFAAQRALVTSAMTSTSDIALHRAKCRKGPILLKKAAVATHDIH
jgi:hypothetical protein